MSEARYAVGVDLGTTHCALSYVDLASSEGEEVQLEICPIPQLTAPGSVEERPLLPSFLYLPHPDEHKAGDLSLPWGGDPTRIAGELARRQGIPPLPQSIENRLDPITSLVELSRASPLRSKSLDLFHRPAKDEDVVLSDLFGDFNVVFVFDTASD